jgi:hypothetical protein
MMRTALTAACLLLLGMSGCFYSFTGSSVPPHLKTIAIPLFDDQSGSGIPGLREELTNKLIERFRQDNSLEVSDDKTHADSMIEGIVISVPDQAQVVATGETVVKRRVTVTVKATFQDMKLRKKMFDKQFSEWGDYESSGGPPDRQAAIDAAIDKLAEDILLDAVSGW